MNGRPNWHYMEQRTPEWFQVKAGKVGGSTVHVVLSNGRDSTEAKGRFNLKVKLATERDTGKYLHDSYFNKDMENGEEREPALKGLYEQTTGEMVTDVGFIDHPTIEWFGVSPDSIVLPFDLSGFPVGGMEGKCPRLTTFCDRVTSRAVPSDHRWQCLALAECAALEWVDYVNFHPDRPEGQQLLIVRVYRNEADISRMVDGVRLFNEEVDEYRHALATAKYFDRELVSK